MRKDVDTGAASSTGGIGQRPQGGKRERRHLYPAAPSSFRNARPESATAPDGEAEVRADKGSSEGKTLFRSLLSNIKRLDPKCRVLVSDNFIGEEIDHRMSHEDIYLLMTRGDLPRVGGVYIPVRVSLWGSCRQIVITRRLFNNVSDLAYTLAHEASHLVLDLVGCSGVDHVRSAMLPKLLMLSGLRGRTDHSAVSFEIFPFLSSLYWNLARPHGSVPEDSSIASVCRKPLGRSITGITSSDDSYSIQVAAASIEARRLSSALRVAGQDEEALAILGAIFELFEECVAEVCASHIGGGSPSRCEYGLFRQHLDENLESLRKLLRQHGSSPRVALLSCVEATDAVDASLRAAGALLSDWVSGRQEIPSVILGDSALESLNRTLDIQTFTTLRSRAARLLLSHALAIPLLLLRIETHLRMALSFRPIRRAYLSPSRRKSAILSLCGIVSRMPKVLTRSWRLITMKEKSNVGNR